MLTLALFCFMGLVPDNNQVLTLKVVSDLRLGGGEEDHEIFADQAQMVADESGQIFIIEPGTLKVLTFDTDGKFLHSFGGKGEGPGEFAAMMAIAIDHKDRVVVFDCNQARMSRFKKDGTYIDDVAMEQGIRTVWTPYFFSNGHMVMGTVKTDAQFQMTYHFGKYDDKLALTKTLSDIPLPQVDWSQASDPKFWVNFLKINMEQVDKGAPFGVVFDDDSFLSVRTDAFKGDFYGQGGKQLGSFSRKIKPKLNRPENKRAVNEALWQNMLANPFLATNLTKSVFEEAYKKAELSDHLLPLSTIFRFGEGFAAIVQYDLSKGEGQLEVFSKKGTLIGKGTYQGPIGQIYGTGNTIYAMGANDEDEINMIRYRVKGL